MDKKVVQKTRELLKISPQEVTQALLEEPFWLSTLQTNVLYQRFEDDSRRGYIGVTFSPDSDGWIEIFSKPDPNEGNSVFRFRTYFGGGQSLRVRNALMVLAEAIRLDNVEKPQHRL